MTLNRTRDLCSSLYDHRLVVILLTLRALQSETNATPGNCTILTTAVCGRTTASHGVCRRSAGLSEHSVFNTVHRIPVTEVVLSRIFPARLSVPEVSRRRRRSCSNGSRIRLSSLPDSLPESVAIFRLVGRSRTIPSILN
ncbi:hypothetical protein L1887_63218 [Cichorium endivia]|nr:hypothetical protein L1887_63218 [Cichorium endivia]